MAQASEVLKQTTLPWLYVGGAVAAMAVLMYFIRSWLRDNDGPAASDHELLAGYSELNQQGELTDEEYRIIKGRMATRLGATARPPEENRLKPTEKLSKDCGLGKPEVPPMSPQTN